MNLDAVRVVLVETANPGNIGGAARAMKNMGLARLILVKPRHFPDPEALWRAAGAGDLLAGAVVVKSLPDAVAHCGLVIGASARSRRLPWPALEARALGPWLQSETGLGDTPIAVVFGREVSGLTNEELQLCHVHVYIPAAPDYGSLNLAMAVQLIAYDLRLATLAGQPDPGPPPSGLAISPDWDAPPATHAEIEHLLAHIDETMLQSGFYDVDSPGQLPNRVRRLFQRLRLDHLEVGILRGWLKAMQQRMPAPCVARKTGLDRET